jgi:hypothetical protein
MSTSVSSSAVDSNSNSNNISVADMDIENPKIPKWTRHEYDKKEIYIDENSGLITSCTDDKTISIIGIWNNALKRRDSVTANTKLYVEKLKNMDVNCVIEPVEIAWLTDVTLSCLDKDVLVVKRCLSNRSVPLRELLEDSNVLDLAYNSSVVIWVMRVLHRDGPGKQLTRFPAISFYQDEVMTDQAIFRFCFQYQIEYLLSDLRTSICAAIKNKSLPSPLSWLKFFHGIKHHDGSEPFADEIKLLLDLVAENENDLLEQYLKSTDYYQKDVISDQISIIRGLCSRIKKRIIVNTSRSEPKWINHTIESLPPLDALIDINSGLTIKGNQFNGDYKQYTVVGSWCNTRQEVMFGLDNPTREHAIKLGLRLNERLVNLSMFGSL